MATTERPDGSDQLDSVAAVELPERIERLADAYDDHLGDRDRFLWRWMYSLFPEFTLSSVADDHAGHVREQKTILTMYVAVLDDLLEDRADRTTFRTVCQCHAGGLDPDLSRPWVDESVPDLQRPEIDEDALAFAEQAWAEFADGLASAPRRDEFAEIFRYDFDQTTNAIEYSAVVSATPQVANLTGTRRYDAHNMVMFPFADVDLMYSPAFDMADFGAVRDLVWDLQELARIGNWLTTWKRELAEEDYSSGVVVTALQEGVVSPGDLASSTPESLTAQIKDHGIEERFRRRWRRLYRSVETRETDAETVDLDALVDGMETVFEYHLASEGLK